DPSMSLAYVNRGNCYRFFGQNQRALEDFTRAIHAQPELFNGWVERGVTNNSLGNYMQAIADYSQAIRLSPADEGAWAWRGMAHGHLNELQRSLDDCRLGIRLRGSPEELGDAYACEGRALALMKDYRGAIEELNRSVELEPDLAQTYRDRGWSFES